MLSHKKSLKKVINSHIVNHERTFLEVPYNSPEHITILNGLPSYGICLGKDISKIIIRWNCNDNTFLHEIGHGLGLDDVSPTNNVMQSSGMKVNNTTTQLNNQVKKNTLNNSHENTAIDGIFKSISGINRVKKNDTANLDLEYKDIAKSNNISLRLSVIREKLSQDGSKNLKDVQGNIILHDLNINYAIFLLVKNLSNSSSSIIWMDYFSEHVKNFPKTLSYVDFFLDESTDIIYIGLANFRSTHGIVKLFAVNLYSKEYESMSNILNIPSDKYPKPTASFSECKLNSFQYDMLPQKIALKLSDNKDVLTVILKEKITNKNLILKYDLRKKKWNIVMPLSIEKKVKKI